MKRLFLAVLLLLLAVGAGYSQSNTGIEVALTSGYVRPASPMAFADYWNIQYGGGLRAGMPLSESVTLIGSFEYYRFKLNSEGVNKAFDANYMRDIWIFKNVTLTPEADPSSLLAVSANLRVAPAQRGGTISPYFIGGIGVLRFTMSDIKVPLTSVLTIDNADIAMTADNRIVGGEQTALLLQSGIGLEINVSTFLSAFAEARYAIGLSRSQTTGYIPLNVGVRFQL